MNNFNQCVLLLNVLWIVSCGGTNTEEITKGPSFELEIGADKRFALDNETAFDGIDGKYVEIDGTGYYTFFNRENHSIYFYDYATTELEHVTKMDKQGPNAVETPYYYLDFKVQDFDNIFINALKFFYRINKDGEVLDKYTEDGDSFKDPSMYLDEATVLKDGKMFTGMRVTVPAKGDTNFLRAVFDFETGTIEEKHIDERMVFKEYETKRDRLEEMAKSGGVMNMNIDFVGNEQWLVAATAIGDSLYFFDDYKLSGGYYAGDPQVAVTNLDGWFSKTKVETFEGGGVSIGPNPVQPAHYTDLLISSDKKRIYRLLIHGTKRVIPEGGEDERPQVIGASLIVFDVDTKTSSSLSLPIDELGISHYSSDTFVTPDGILFPVKDVESESEKVYKLLKVKSQSE